MSGLQPRRTALLESCKKVVNLSEITHKISTAWNVGKASLQTFLSDLAAGLASTLRPSVNPDLDLSTPTQLTSGELDVFNSTETWTDSGVGFVGNHQRGALSKKPLQPLGPPPIAPPASNTP